MWSTPALVTVCDPKCRGVRPLPLSRGLKSQTEGDILEELLNLTYGMYHEMRDTDKLRKELVYMCSEVHPTMSTEEALQHTGVDNFNNTAYSSIVNDVDVSQPFPDSTVSLLSNVSEVIGMCRTILHGDISCAPYQLALLHISLTKLGHPMSSFAEQIRTNFDHIRKGFNEEQTIWLDDLLNSILDSVTSAEVQQAILSPMVTFFRYS
eukprot:TRINITY_DN1185_c5_g1_i1.p1 TRINITY_DN1185_c5_g1~~TRINITY_DN1185_c5_g1_i1.p1  ORF type:complete len:208 (+),score=27.17 TRINITY_DN1185_c5_g1_i1:43-666(+)